MTENEAKLFQQIAGTLAALRRDLARLQGREHAEHRSQITKGIIAPSTPACPPDTVREEQAPGIPFSRLLRPCGNGNGHAN